MHLIPAYEFVPVLYHNTHASYGQFAAGGFGGFRSGCGSGNGPYFTMSKPQVDLLTFLLSSGLYDLAKESDLTSLAEKDVTINEETQAFVQILDGVKRMSNDRDLLQMYAKHQERVMFLGVYTPEQAYEAMSRYNTGALHLIGEMSETGCVGVVPINTMLEQLAARVVLDISRRVRHYGEFGEEPEENRP